MNSGFNYRLKLPVLLGVKSKDQLKTKVNALNLSPLRIQTFKSQYHQAAAFAQIGENKMVLLSLESRFKMYAELFQDESTQNDGNSFALQEEFTSNHMIKMVLEDKDKQQAIFVTQSVRSSSIETNNYLIDTVTFLKLVIAADGKLKQQQITIIPSLEQANTIVICSPSNNKDCIYCYCFF